MSKGEVGGRMSHAEYEQVLAALYHKSIRGQLTKEEAGKLAAAVEQHKPETCDRCLRIRKIKKETRSSWITNHWASEMS